MPKAHETIDVIGVLLDRGLNLENSAVFQAQFAGQFIALANLGYRTAILVSINDKQLFLDVIGASLNEAGVEVMAIPERGFLRCFFSMVFFLRRLTSFTHQPTTTARKVNSYRQWGFNYLVHSQRRTYSNLSDNYSRVLIAQATSIDAFHNIRGIILIETAKRSIVNVEKSTESSMWDRRGCWSNGGGQVTRKNNTIYADKWYRSVAFLRTPCIAKSIHS